MTAGVTAAIPPFVIAAVLGAALLHATWNALVKGRARQGGPPDDPLPPMVLVVAGGALASALLLPFTAAPAPASWPFIAASSVAQVAYHLLLIETYAHGDMSHAYPLMRGSAPLLVALVNGVLTGERLNGAQWIAICLICGGVLAMLLGTRTPHAPQARRSQRRATAFALATACVIALYTMIDGAGVRRSGAPAAYTMWIFLLTGSAVTAWAARGRRRELLRLAGARPLLLPLGGVSTLGSYGIALWAMTLAPVAAIAALRETSILFATAIAALFLRERVGAWRLVAAGLIACGAVAMRLA
ncbi:EamA family transporter [Massilia sp. LXY-6]|uniref:EamA family transporter n=1 Tax=Massilia sp. LXY-6 TaxID=3379823 RepID=UPI003EDEEE78